MMAYCRRQAIHGTRAVVPLPKLSTVVIMKAPPPEPAPVTGATVRDVTAKLLPKPLAAFVTNIGAPRKIAVSLRISAFVMVTLLEPDEIDAMPPNGKLVEAKARGADWT